MADTLVLLQLEHRTISRLLALVDEQATRIEEGGGGEHGLLQLVFEYFADFPDLCHHPKEDLVFRRLQKKDAAAAESVGNLLLDHETLAQLTVSTAEWVSTAADNGGLQRPGLVAALRKFVAEYRRHLDAEEGYFFPAVSEALDRDDWDLIDFTMFDQKDPLYDEDAEGRFRALRQRIWESRDEMGGEPD